MKTFIVYTQDSHSLGFRSDHVTSFTFCSSTQELSVKMTDRTGLSKYTGRVATEIYKQLIAA
jgi:hypothetical protein